MDRFKRNEHPRRRDSPDEFQFRAQGRDIPRIQTKNHGHDTTRDATTDYDRDRNEDRGYKGQPRMTDMSTIYNLNEGISDSFVPDEDHLDCTESYGLKLRAKVPITSFTRENGTAGKDVRTIRLIDVMWKGIENYGLRCISNGRYANVQITRSFKETKVIQELLYLIRGKDEKNSLDLDILAQTLAKSNGKHFTSQDQKKEAYTDLAAKIFQQLQEWMPATTPTGPDPAVMAKMREMEQQIADLTMAQQLQKQDKATARASSSKAPRSLLECFNKAADQKQEEGTTLPTDDDEINGMAPMERGDRTRVLAKNAPSGPKPMDVANWIKKLTLTVTKKAKLKNTTDQLFNHYKSLPKIQQTGLGNIAVDWGLNCKMAGKMTDDILIKILAVAICISN